MLHVKMQMQGVRVVKVQRFISVGIAAALVCGPSLSCEPAAAFWFFGHKDKQKDQEGTSKRKKRAVAGVEVGLVPGAPAALCWKPSGNAKAVVLCLHELGMHKGVFDDLGQRLSHDQMAVYAIDLRGFGGWADEKSHDSKMDLDKTLTDVKDSVEILHKLHPDVPVFVLGEAMGGALALEAATKFPNLIQGTISSAPQGEHYKTVSNYTRVSVRLMTNGPNGQFTNLGHDLIERGTPKAELREALRNDADVRLDITPKEMMTCQFYMYTTKKLARNIKDTPVLIVQGEKDGESKPKGSLRVYNALATKDKKFLSVPDGDHYVFEDIRVNDDVVKTTLSWIDDHLAQKPATPASGG